MSATEEVLPGHAQHYNESSDMPEDIQKYD